MREKIQRREKREREREREREMRYEMNIMSPSTPSLDDHVFHPIGDLLSVASKAYLGIELHERLSWKSHVDAVTNKASRTLGFIQRNLGRQCPTQGRPSDFQSGGGGGHKKKGHFLGKKGHLPREISKRKYTNF